MSIWTKAVFWTKVKDSLAIGGLLTQGGMEALNSSEVVKQITAAATIIAYLVGMWMEDRDKDGVVDIFQSEKVVTITTDADAKVDVTTEIKKADKT